MVDNSRELNFYRIIEKGKIVQVIKIFEIKKNRSIRGWFILRNKLMTFYDEKYCIYNIEADLDDIEILDSKEFEDLEEKDIIKFRDEDIATVRGYGNIINIISKKCYEIKNGILLEAQTRYNYCGNNIFRSKKTKKYYELTDDYGFCEYIYNNVLATNNDNGSIFDKNNNKVLSKPKIISTVVCYPQFITELSKHVFVTIDRDIINFYSNEKIIRTESLYEEFIYEGPPYMIMCCYGLESEIIRKRLNNFLKNVICIPDSLIYLITNYC